MTLQDVENLRVEIADSEAPLGVVAMTKRVALELVDLAIQELKAQEANRFCQCETDLGIDNTTGICDT